MYVCICRAVSEADLERALLSGARTTAEVAAATGAGTRCGKCRERISHKLQCSGNCAGCSSGTRSTNDQIPR